MVYIQIKRTLAEIWQILILLFLKDRRIQSPKTTKQTNKQTKLNCSRQNWIDCTLVLCLVLPPHNTFVANFS